MLDAIDTGGNRHAQPFDARRVCFSRAVPLVRLLDDDALGIGGETDEGRLGKVARAAELQKVGPFVEVGADSLAQLLRCHRHQFLAAALCDVVVHLLLEQRQLAHHAAERKRIRAAPAEDVARRKNARTGLLATRDPVANLRERHQRPVAVAHGRDAVAQVDLRRFQHDVVLPRLVLCESLVSIVLAAVEREVHVRVDEPRDDPLAARIDLAGVGRDRHRTPRPNRRDA